MKSLFLNHKYQAFYISFLSFLPIFFLIFHSADFFKIKFNNKEVFALSIKQFTRENSTPIQENKILEKITPKVKKIQSKIIKKEGEKIKKIEQKKASTPIENPTKQMTENPSQITQLTQGKDKHPLLEQIQKAIQKVQSYPRQAQKMRMQGIVKVEFLWKENKTLAELKIIQSSGYTLLDKNALESIRKASVNFPYYKNDLRIVLPIVYKIN
ncbi:energy transducer TonB [Campylobacter estrildidarum]|uniref:Energy transducer TonB n=1 Tax=Campylobacter estrildidarum TaxID=2510189 RepID=A0A4V6DWE7_9BACT|nr:energy transducer TonB [Campylobacter estrildidarum]TKX31532.1 energy transducer TonB [Campylobacter estrildidarum]